MDLKIGQKIWTVFGTQKTRCEIISKTTDEWFLDTDLAEDIPKGWVVCFDDDDRFQFDVYESNFQYDSNDCSRNPNLICFLNEEDADAFIEKEFKRIHEINLDLLSKDKESSLIDLKNIIGEWDSMDDLGKKFLSAYNDGLLIINPSISTSVNISDYIKTPKVKLNV